MGPLYIGPLTLETVSISIRDLPQPLEGCRIVQLSDFHCGDHHLPTRLLQQVVERVNDLKPDLIALTGDYVTQEPSPIFRLATYLQQMTSRCGTVAVLGNHDNITVGGRQTIVRSLQQAGIYPLWNEVVYPLGPDLPVVGLADFWSPDFNPGSVLDGLSPTQPRLVLSHNPDTAERLLPWRVDLQLSGHTHGGQIVLPGLGPLPAITQGLRQTLATALPIEIPYLSRKCLKVVRHWEWVSGLHSLGRNQLYVNRGLGTYAPGRWRCPPEMTVLELVSG